MNPLLLLIITGVGLATWAFSRTGNVLLKLEFELLNARIHNVSLSETVIKFNLNVKNPTKKACTVQSYKLDVFYNNKIIANINRPSVNYKISPLGNLVLKDISASIKNLEVIDQLLNIFSGEKVKNQITVKGSLTADGLTFPINNTSKLIEV